MPIPADTFNKPSHQENIHNLEFLPAKTMQKHDQSPDKPILRGALLESEQGLI